MRFELAEFIFKIKSEGELHLPPFKGSAIRGGFGNAFKRITCHFLTPTRLKSDGKLTLDIDFATFLRNLLRWISLLSYFHCGEELNIDYRGMIEKAKSVTVSNEKLRWTDWERYSARQDTRMKLG